MAKEGETEVFYITPEKGKCYFHAEYTRKSGTYSERNERYFTTNKPTYVGKFTDGWGAQYGAASYFINDITGEQNTVHYSYEGKTCFIEVNCEDGKEVTSAGKKGGKRRRTRRVRKLRKTKRAKKSRRNKLY